MKKNGLLARWILVSRPITPEQAKDTGMAMTLLALIVGLYSGNQWCFVASVTLLVIDMIVPAAYRPIAKVWLGLSAVLGSIVSRILLTMVFFLIITPIGKLKRSFGFEPLQLNKWKNGDSSMFTGRNQTYAPSDLESPF